MRAFAITVLLSCGLVAGWVVAPDLAAPPGVRVDVPGVKLDVGVGSDRPRSAEPAARMSEILGMTVRNAEGKKLGTIQDVMIGVDDGRIRYAALSSGGLLGIGEQLVAIPWHALKWQHDRAQGEKWFLLDVDQETLRNAPRIDPHHWPDFLDRHQAARFPVSVDVGRDSK